MSFVSEVEMRDRAKVLGAVVLLILLPAVIHAQSLRRVFRKVSPSVVVVQTLQRETASWSPTGFVTVPGIGSGVLISENQILTAAHVVQTADEVDVVFPTGERFPARVAASQPSADLALLEIQGVPEDVKPAKLGDSDKVEVGDQIFIVGAPLGVSHTLTVGHVSARRTPNLMFGPFAQAEYIQTDAAINQGNSGGPMFNLKGEVIGIVSYIVSQSGGSQGLGFAVSSNSAQELLLSSPTPWTGLEGILLTGAMARVFNVPDGRSGLLIQRVATGSPAALIGLRPGFFPAQFEDQEVLLGGDIILSVLGIQIGDVGSQRAVANGLNLLSSGEVCDLTILRGGEIQDITVITP